MHSSLGPVVTTAYSFASMSSTLTTGSTNAGGYGFWKNSGKFDESIIDEERIKIAQKRRIRLENPSIDAGLIEQMPDHVTYQRDTGSDGYSYVQKGNDLWLTVTVCGPKISTLRYIENNTLATFLFLLGYFETEDMSNKVISKILDKYTYKAIQNS